MIDLRCGDCLEIMKKIPDNSVDLIIIDPPYEFCKGGDGGVFGIKKRKHHQQYLDLYHETHNESDRINYNKHRNMDTIKGMSYGFDLNILDILVKKK